MAADPIPLFDGAPIRVLLIEDDEEDYRRTCDLLDAARHVTFAIDWAQSVQDAMKRLGTDAYDVVLVDHGLPDGRGLDLVRTAHNRGLRAPIIMLTGCSSLEVDLDAMALGASDFLDKSRVDVTLLERTIRYALARHRQAERLNRLAQYDELTGLANRSLFQDRLGRALAWARRHNRLAAVMILDLNGFKAVNDRLGHGAGDRLLAIMANRLTRRLRETDTIARLGGDEFALLIENLAKPEHAALVARKLLDTVAPPVEVDAHRVSVTASLGVALYPKDASDAAELMRQADRAMYRAKAEGGNLCRFSSDQLERRVQRGALLESDLRRALEQGELLLHYQPQITLRAGSLGISAIIRWAHPELGLIGPERFLPLAEDAGLLRPLTEWLFDAGCAQARRWRALGIERMHLALPLLSRQQLAWNGLAGRLQDHLDRAGLAPGLLEIEVSEELLLADADAGGLGLAALREVGVRIALDGFGRGPMSLRSLQPGRLDTLKLAREIHQDVPDDHQRGVVVRALLALGKDLGLRVVAEGVDRHEQLGFLRGSGCDAVQAFMSCPPLPPDACTGWLRRAAARREGPRPTIAVAAPLAPDARRALQPTSLSARAG
ncbi:MAG: putative bifunctional diguanylate cyclase/phosphodiesterase [Geminicoccaceae bacterium]